MDAIREQAGELIAISDAGIDAQPGAGRQLAALRAHRHRAGHAGGAARLLPLPAPDARAAARPASGSRRRCSSERDPLEGEVRERTATLAELATHLQQVREDERGHLARELHDELGALLTAAKLDVARLKSRLAAVAGGRAAPAAPERTAQQRHRAEAPHHRGPAALVAVQPRADRLARDPGARVRRALGHRGRDGARAGASSTRRASSPSTGWCRRALTNIGKYAAGHRGQTSS